jgi:hypothetical protein
VDTGRVEGPGRWVVPAFRFTGSGNWRLDVEVRLEDGRHALRTFPVRVTGRATGG